MGFSHKNVGLVLHELMKEMISMKCIIYCTAGTKSNEIMLPRSYERNLRLRREARTSTAFEPATSRYRCDALTD